jgi:hypothetical protein
MKSLYIVPLLLLLWGCGAYDPIWSLRHVPTTDIERERVAEEAQRILSATPQSLAGHDQDWDDAIEAAQNAATKTWCRATLWEYASTFGTWRETGRWRYADPAP